VILFLHRLPLYRWVDPRDRTPISRWSVSLPIIAADPDRLAGPTIGSGPWPRWVFDSGYSGEAFGYRSHLEEVNLSPSRFLIEPRSLRPAFGRSVAFPTRRLVLWLISNIPGENQHPYRIELNPGFSFHNTPAPDPRYDRPLIGINALLRAHLRVQLDFAKETISVWTPAPWHRALQSYARWAVTGLQTLPALFAPDT
jgi:hypothetical protein